MTTKEVSTGGCFCGAVHYEVRGKLRDVINCHCTQCQKLNGSFGAHSKAQDANIKIVKDEGLIWFDITDRAKRGFCKKCGSGLFWKLNTIEATGIISGSLDNPDGLTTMGHIFVSEKPDYYKISDKLPKFEKSSNGQLEGDY